MKGETSGTSERFARSARVSMLRPKESGFSLVEMAIVLLILGVLMSAAIQPLSARMEAGQRTEAKAQLDQVKSAMIGYLVLNGRLPCPGTQVIRDDSPCALIEGGIKAALLGLPGEIDEEGLLLDVWGERLLYRISSKHPWESRMAGEVDLNNSPTVASIAARDDEPIEICQTAPQANCRKKDLRVDQLEFVVLTHGRDRSSSPSQVANLDGDSIFVKSPFSSAIGREFDDKLVWMSRSEMAYWLLRSGRTQF